jgi:hypothetical protein
MKMGHRDRSWKMEMMKNNAEREREREAKKKGMKN